MVRPRRPRRCRHTRANHRGRGQLPEGRTRAPPPSSVMERHLPELQFTRRQTIATLAASAAIPLIAKAALSFSVRTSLDVVKSAYRTALKGFAFPYGDVAVGGYRNTPYVVIQNVGAYIDTPQFLDTDHLIETKADAEAYLSRLAQFPGQLAGELQRLKAARARGLV